MKKLFMFLAVAGLATFGTSCGSDDNKGGDDPAQKALALSSDVTSVEEGQSVNFSVKVEGKVEAGAELYIGDAKIANPAKFDTAGKFTVVAKKKGFVDSNAVVITVTEAGTVNPEPEETLVLKPVVSPGQVAVGATLSFFFTDASGTSVTGAKLMKNGVEINGSEYVVAEADAETTLKFTAKKGDLVSNEVVYTVKPIPATLTTNFFKFDGVQYEVDQAAFLYTGNQPFGDGVIDTYTLVLLKAEGQEIENRIMGTVAFKRVDPAVKVLPTNGPIVVAAYGAFVFEGDGQELDVPAPTNETSFELSGMTLVDEEAGIKVAENGKIVFNFVLSGTDETVSGLYEGAFLVFTEQQGGGAQAKSFKAGKAAKTAKFSHKK